MSKNPKTIYCPKCKRIVAHYDGRSTINIITKCEKCRKRVVYHIDTDVTEIKDIPQRASSSGMTFY
jgi:phage FluMu protein Com